MDLAPTDVVAIQQYATENTIQKLTSCLYEGFAISFTKNR